MCPVWNKSYQEALSQGLEGIIGKAEERSGDVADASIAPALKDIKIGSGRYLRAAVLFFDIRGFTELTSSPEREHLKEVLYLLDVVIPMVMKIVYDYNGYVEKNTGDGIMALFGADESDEVAAESAIDAAVVMMHVVKKMINPKIRALGMKPIEVRIGIDQGSLILGRVGLPKGMAKQDRNFLSAVGPAANIASKIQQMANSDEIWCGDQIKTFSESWRTQYFSDVTPSNWTWVRQNNINKTYQIWEYSGRKKDQLMSLMEILTRPGSGLFIP